VHAWDTETINIDAKEDSPVGHGYVISAQCFIGPDVDFGNGPRLFIDNYADSKGVLLEFKDYFKDAGFLKCWHNYGFDRHVMRNTGIECAGFGGDTMHMARLADASRMPNQYALSALSDILEKEIEETKQEIIQLLKKTTDD